MPRLLGLRPVAAQADAWCELAHQAQERVPARDLYLGRSFRDARSAAATVQGTLYIASAGFGLLHESDQVPNYNLTVSQGAGSIQELLAACASSSADWWRALTEALGTPSPLSNLVQETSTEHVLLALPSSYLRMLADELVHLTPGAINKFYIFTSAAGVACLPTNLKARVLPYDARLERVPGFAGTMADFPQRALRHFVEVFQGELKDPKSAAKVVNSLLGPKASVEKARRTKLSDAQIQELLRSQWAAQAGSSTRLLRYLRDDAQVACEQGRFRQLWLSLKAQAPA